MATVWALASLATRVEITKTSHAVASGQFCGTFAAKSTKRNKYTLNLNNIDSSPTSWVQNDGKGIVILSVAKYLLI